MPLKMYLPSFWSPKFFAKVERDGVIRSVGFSLFSPQSASYFTRILNQLDADSLPVPQAFTHEKSPCRHGGGR